MTSRLLACGLLLILGCRRADEASSSAAHAPAPVSRAEPRSQATWSFDDDAVGGAPKGFSFARTGSGRPGTWQVVEDPTAPSRPHVLAQRDEDTTDDRFPVAIAEAPPLRDVRISVKCKPISGEVDQAVGLVFRYRDADNYYLTRANAIEGNVRLYFVKDGRRRQIVTWSGSVTSGAWHEYRVDARGERIEVWWDGARLFDHRDTTFPDAGRVGVWTKADSVSYFDDIVVEGL